MVYGQVNIQIHTLSVYNSDKLATFILTTMKALELKVPPVIVVFFFALLMWAIAKFIPGDYFIFSGQNIVGWFFYAIGALCSVLGVYQFRKAHTTIDPRFPDQTSVLVRSGIYRLSRNPMYLGFLFILIGWAFQLSHSFNFLLLPLFVLYMNLFQIFPEERFLASKFGAEYLSYQASVRRWL